MNTKVRSILAVFLTGLWVNASEFFRNEILLKGCWVSHYRSLGMTFPSGPVNSMIWAVWGVLFSLAIYVMSRRFSLLQTALLSWFAGFVLMWIVTLNLNVLPAAILVYAVPLGMLEAFVGSWICLKTSPGKF